jgi:hypothetical protein
LFVGVLTITGCGGEDGRRTVPVSGIVTMGGKPLDGAEVYFFSEKFSGMGMTDAEGKYKLVQGTFPGENRVFITKIEGGSGENLPTELREDPEQMRVANESLGATPGSKRVGPQQVVPEHYSNPEKTKLTFQVPENGSNSANFDL